MPPMSTQRLVVAKVTRLYKEGFESRAEDVTFDDGHLRFPLADGNWAWRVYLPFHGFSTTGPWYAWRVVTERLVECIAGRRLPVDYRDEELWPELCPDDKPISLQLPFPPEPPRRPAQKYNLADAVAILGMQGSERDWPDVLYENPADFFDDNQVIDG